jgi:Ca-activated chloride channel family protein
VFTPLGVRQDSPLYALEGITVEQKEALRLFAEYCMAAPAQTVAADMSFNQFDSFSGEEIGMSGRAMFEALKLWKQHKDGGDPVISVFVMDTSGSMDNPGRWGGAKRINNAKTALLNSLQYINEDNYVGLLSYSSTSNICVDAPVRQFDAAQRSLFAGAIRDLKASGNTATNSAIVAALDMAVKAKNDLNLPQARIRILVFTDGATNQDNLTLAQIEGMIHGLGVPLYGVFFEPEKDSDMYDLDKLSAINEGYKITADTDDVVSQLKSLFIRTL